MRLFSTIKHGILFLFPKTSKLWVVSESSELRRMLMEQLTGSRLG